MFGQLKPIVDLLSSGVTDVLSAMTKLQRRRAVLLMLETHFLLKDCMEEGTALVAEAGPNPISTISAMSVQESIATTEGWEITLKKQAIRLRMLQDRIFAQDHLSIVAPQVQKSIDKAIGSKFDRVVTIESIGAALLIQTMFGLAKTPQARAELVIAMVGARKDKINVTKIKKEVAALGESLESYRGVIEKLVTSEEIVRLSSRARKSTQFQPAKAQRPRTKPQLEQWGPMRRQLRDSYKLAQKTSESDR